MGTDAPAEVDILWEKYVEHRTAELRNELITLYAPLVRFVVGRLGIPPTGLLDAEDLVSYGMIGLINAIDRFDPARGVRFEAFASVRIRGAVIDQLRSLNWLPRSAISRVRQVESALAVLEQRLGRPAKENEVAEEIGVSTERYRQMLLEMNATVLSLDAPLGSLLQDDEVTSLSELLEDQSSPGPVEQAEQQELTDILGEAVDHLPEREKLLLALYYQEELTMKEISKVLSVSESRVCQLHIQAIMRLRSALHTYRLDEGEQGETVSAGRGRKKHSGAAKGNARPKENTGSVSHTYANQETRKTKALSGNGSRGRRKIS
ncbi:sigma-70 family RNA polymerase sigma factor [Dictyobacter formicarum]|uniref:RNA polymerase sigma factor n=1 Tax=Dictyobacter formicarum TaxID=2778368 RepID=A0ABQ3VPP3_9CHLR|nr:FliA/WhiG family RNA polymerase sigma factor [Dictyobacter formicarum]GHO87808.1 sigma 28 (flagella/sporulation) [Dictyobacter formicarum]